MSTEIHKSPVILMVDDNTINLQLLHVNNRIQQHIGLEHASFIAFQLVPVDNKKVLLIECQTSPSPVFLKISNEEEFYVRVGPGSRRLSTSEVVAYVTNRTTAS